MQRFYMSPAKVPESPYTPDLFNTDGHLADPSKINAGRRRIDAGQQELEDPSQSYLIQKGPLAFGSTYEASRGNACGTGLAQPCDNVPNDFRVQECYQQEVNWPITYDDLSSW